MTSGQSALERTGYSAGEGRCKGIGERCAGGRGAWRAMGTRHQAESEPRPSRPPLPSSRSKRQELKTARRRTVQNDESTQRGGRGGGARYHTTIRRGDVAPRNRQ